MELRIDNVTKVYGKKAAVVDFSTMMYSGVYGILGANGAGKTTLLRMIAELQNRASNPQNPQYKWLRQNSH